MIEPVAEADLLQRGLRPLAAVAKPDAGVEETIGDIVEGRDARRQVEVLEHEADAAGAQGREIAVPERRHIEPVDLDRRPQLARSSVPMMLSIVDLPEPDGPTMATSSPRPISRLTSRSAKTPPANARVTLRSDTIGWRHPRHADPHAFGDTLAR